MKRTRILSGLAVLALMLSALSLASCGETQQENPVYGVVTPEGDKLYEVTFDEYADNYDAASAYLASKYKASGTGCTAIYKDGMLFRNLDWYIREDGVDVCETVIRTTANEGRYATVGVVNNPLVTDETYDSLTEEQLAILPFILTDGMNSEGLMYSQNVCPEVDGISYTCGTNPNGEDLVMFMAGRALLDYCANVDEAIEYLQNHNFYCPAYDGDYLMESHLMLADRERAVIIEFVGNEMVVLEQEDLPYDEPFMTNHYLYNGGENTGHGMGYERDRIVRTEYAAVDGWEDGMKLLEKLKYSNAYTIELGEDFWYSEYLVMGEYNGVSYDFNKDTPTDDPTFLAFISALQAKYEVLADICWWSNHSAVYEPEKGVLHLAVREDYETLYEFSLPG